MAFTWVLMRWWWAWLLLRYLASITRSPDLQAAVLPIRNNVWALSALCIEERFISNWERNKENNNYKIHKTKINSDGTKRSKFSLIKSLSSPNTLHFISGKVLKVQGLFIRHILNYTGYNQKWNVNQDRSAQWTVQKNKNVIKVTQHKSIYI